MKIKDINLDDYEISQQADEEIIVLRKKSKYPKWKDLKEIHGVFINNKSNLEIVYASHRSQIDKNIFLTNKHAKSTLAMAQISQLMPYYCGEITDEEWLEDKIKYTIGKKGKKAYGDERVCTYMFLAFHTEEQRDEFLKNNEQLVKDYLMIE